MHGDDQPSQSIRKSRGVGGLLVVLAGVFAYFVVVLLFGARLPSVGRYAVPNWVLIAVGVAMTWRAVRAAPDSRAPKILLGLNLLVAVFFAHFLYRSTSVPVATGLSLGTSAPAFELTDQRGQTVRLADFRGGPLLLVFYRGHW